MEAEVVQMCVNMFRGGKDACGTVCVLEYTVLPAFSQLGVLCMQTFLKKIVLYFTCFFINYCSLSRHYIDRGNNNPVICLCIFALERKLGTTYCKAKKKSLTLAGF